MFNVWYIMYFYLLFTYMYKVRIHTYQQDIKDKINLSIINL